MAPVTTHPSKNYLAARAVWERYDVTSMTISRWLADPRLAFPRPIYIGRYRYWVLEELEHWERSRAAKREAA